MINPFVNGLWLVNNNNKIYFYDLNALVFTYEQWKSPEYKEDPTRQRASRNMHTSVGVLVTCTHAHSSN